MKYNSPQEWIATRFVGRGQLSKQEMFVSGRTISENPSCKWAPVRYLIVLCISSGLD